MGSSRVSRSGSVRSGARCESFILTTWNRNPVRSTTTLPGARPTMTASGGCANWTAATAGCTAAAFACATKGEGRRGWSEPSATSMRISVLRRRCGSRRSVMRWRWKRHKTATGTGSSARASTTCRRATCSSTDCPQTRTSPRARIFWPDYPSCLRTGTRGCVRWQIFLPARAPASAWSCARTSLARRAGSNSAACAGAMLRESRSAGRGPAGT